MFVAKVWNALRHCRALSASNLCLRCSDEDDSVMLCLTSFVHAHVVWVPLGFDLDSLELLTSDIQGRLVLMSCDSNLGH